MKYAKTIAFLTLAVLLLGIAGCDQKVDPGLQRATLKGGKKVPQEMVGWVAMPHTTAPEIREDKSRGISYAVLGTENVIADQTNGWVAINPKFFTKFADVKIDPPATKQTEIWQLDYKGKKIPKELTGWVAIPNVPPKVESSAGNKDMQMATIWANQIIPQEMNGWVAIDKDTLAKLAEKYMATGPGSELPKQRSQK